MRELIEVGSTLMSLCMEVIGTFTSAGLGGYGIFMVLTVRDGTGLLFMAAGLIIFAAVYLLFSPRELGRERRAHARH